jgi:hypothetical protein
VVSSPDARPCRSRTKLLGCRNQVYAAQPTGAEKWHFENEQLKFRADRRQAIRETGLWDSSRLVAWCLSNALRVMPGLLHFLIFASRGL